ncbi:hypothetical protein PoB_005721500 [Plakobranchus ocellatus]|uniref:Uncharacterized protein n=1 Tax=Plakobranchus ocellatus TaxID=259542 RepID=A0AAV4CG57_9GAST|nr:hypothetical protein PoB_005721500 [Plakobranchus ocellatus]
MRTREGKILNREKESVAGQHKRTISDDFIMETWSFQIQHIVRGKHSQARNLDSASATLTVNDDEDAKNSVCFTVSQTQPGSVTTGKRHSGKGKQSKHQGIETATSAFTAAILGVNLTVRLFSR